MNLKEVIIQTREMYLLEFVDDVLMGRDDARIVLILSALAHHYKIGTMLEAIALLALIIGDDESKQKSNGSIYDIREAAIESQRLSPPMRPAS